MPCRLTSGVVPGGPSLPQPDLTGAALSELTLSYWAKSLCVVVGVKKISRPIRNRTAV